MRTYVQAVILASTVMSFAGSATPQSTKEIMEMKLDHAQELLKAVALADFSAVAEHASRLEWLAEASSWFVLPTDEYARHSTEFRDTARALSEAGKNQNLDEAAARYGEMANECVQCHKYVRGARAKKD